MLAAIVAYVAVRGELRGQVDDSLREIGARVADLPPGPGPLPDDVLAGPSGGPEPPGPSNLFVQRIEADGTASQPSGVGAALPVDATAREIAAAGTGSELTDAEVDGQPVRVLTVGRAGGGAVQVARSLESTNDVLSNLRIVLFLVIGGGTAIAALLARRLADRVIAPITQVTEAAEHISETEDLSSRIETGSDDEVGRLAARFNSMLETLEASRAELADSVTTQRRLVADASHELRTPVASVRTDIEVLRDNPQLPAQERRRMLEGLDARIAELGALITDVIELARGDEVEVEATDTRLDLLTREAVERMRGLAPGREIELRAEDCVVAGRPDRLGRAINNLLDNAVKYSPAETPIEVSVRNGEVIVRDHGPGIAPAELELVFDRFHRGARVRAVAGSGLGLAIVKQVAESHAGTATAANAADGGAIFSLKLPER